VLTPITVRCAPDGSGEYLLIKGQGRTLACRLLGLETIPAVVVDDHWAETEKVQQFLVENVARLRMRAVDRALLIAHARGEGEETVDVAKRFGVSAATVRRLEAQLDGASSGEVDALRSGGLTLSLHAVIARHAAAGERELMIDAAAGTAIRAKDMEPLLQALGWRALCELGPEHRGGRMRLLRWACDSIGSMPKGPIAERIASLAVSLPFAMPTVLEPEECA
jgi:ParB/RepB/Spo0J family partition protein